MKCGNCQGLLFTITKKKSCHDCVYNGFFDEEADEWQFGELPSNDIERTMVEEEGECFLNSAYGEGCYLFICSECSSKSNVALIG